MPRRALVIGCNYAGSSCELRGCHCDANAIAEHLTKLQYEVVLLLDDETHIKPTREHMIAELHKLATWTHVVRGGEVFIHYSGHGSQTVDLSGDETDGLDEVLVPCDFNKPGSGLISDDWLWQMLSSMNRDCRIFALFDCCHSGSAMDIPSKHSSGGPTVFLMSGCKDSQTSADAFAVDGVREWSGALTSALLHCLHNEDAAVCNNADLLLTAVRKFVSKGGFDQIPQLTRTCDSADIDFFF